MSAASEVERAARQGRTLLPRTWDNLSRWIGALFTRRPSVRAPRNATKGVLLLLVATLAAGGLAIAFLDAAAIGAQRSLSRTVVAFFSVVTDAGKGSVYLVPSALAVIAIAMLPAQPRFQRFILTALASRIGFIFVAVGAPSLFATILKRLIGRERPNVWVLGDPLSFVPFNWEAAFASLPSGHATTAFAAAVALGALLPRWRVLLLAAAVLVSLSRVGVSTHYPSDVLVGAAVGGVGAYAVRQWFAVRRLAFVIAADGGVRPMPLPPWRRIRKAIAAFRP